MDRFREKDMPPWCRSAVPGWRRSLGEPGSKAHSLSSAERVEQKLLRQLALQCGIQLSFVDMGGRRHEASLDALRALIPLWGYSVENARECRQALRDLQERHAWQAVEPVIVAWDGRPCTVEFRLPRSLENAPVFGKIHLENGASKNLECRFSRLDVKREIRFGGERFTTRALELPPLPMGYHQLELEVRHRLHRALIISAPMASYAPENLRGWGAFCPLYALSSGNSWGAGNFSDWAGFRRHMSKLGGMAVSCPPLLAAGYTPPIKDPSPYSPLSRLFWNEFYLDLTAVPEMGECREAKEYVASPAFQKQLEKLRSAPLIDYEAGMRLRWKVLGLLAESFFEKPSTRRDLFESYSKNHPRLQDYAQFRAVMDRSERPWQEWESRLFNGRIEAGDYRESVFQTHAYAQWLAADQVCAATARTQPGLAQVYLDLPVGVHSSGYDVWRERDSFAFPMSVGAPPDAFFTKGQNWGFAPLHPQRVRENGYSYVREFLGFQMKHAGMLRIDHVMGLHRLYWIAPGIGPQGGVYVKYAAEEWHAIVNLESHRHKTLIVGEDLGTVPPEVTEAMARHQLRRMFVVQFEQQPDTREAVLPPPRQSVASINTHDMPTFAAHWTGADLKDRASLGLLRPERLREAGKARAALNEHLAKFLRAEGWLKEEVSVESVYQACVRWLCASPAEVVLVALEDLWGELEPQNTPGTGPERPNWRRRLKRSLEEIESDPKMVEFLGGLKIVRNSTTPEDA